MSKVYNLQDPANLVTVSTNAQGFGSGIRNVHEELLVSVAFKHWRILESVSPFFLHYGCTGPSVSLIESTYLVKLDLLVQI